MAKKETKRTFKIDTRASGSGEPPMLDIQKAKSAKMALDRAIEDAKEPKKDEPEEKVEDPENPPVEDPDGALDDDFGPALDLLTDHLRKTQKLLESKELQEKVKKELCTPMTIKDLLMKGEFRQTVEVIKGEMKIEFRSITTEESLELKKIMARVPVISDRYFMDMLSFYEQAMAVVSINGERLPSHKDDKGVISKDLLDKKLEYILSFPTQVTAVITMHYYWFDIRVREMMDIEKLFGDLKNG